MPFVSGRDRKAYFQQLTPYQYEEDVTALETLGAAFGQSVDEDLMISSELNNEIYHTRREIVKSLINDGVISRAQYSKGLVGIDYDKISADLEGTEYEGMVYTNERAKEIRNQVLANRRAEREDIIRRGSGFAQFVGTAGALMLDPINFIGLGVGLAMNTGRGLSTLGRALYTARTEAGIAAVTETAIQPFVFAHKEDIDSPYSAQQAIFNIAAASAFAGAFGGVVGGVSGYLYKAKTAGREAYINNLPSDFKFKVEVDGKTIELGKDDLQPFFDEYRAGSGELIAIRSERDEFIEGTIEAFETNAIDADELARLLREGDPVARFDEAKARVDSVERVLNAAARASGGERLATALETINKSIEVVDSTRKNYNDDPKIIFLQEYDKWIDGRVATKQEVVTKTIEKIKKQIERTRREEKKMTGWIMARGGLNKKSFASELGLDPSMMNVAKTGFPRGFWRNEDGGLTVDGLREALREDPTLAFEFRIDPNAPDEAIDITPWIEALMADKDMLRDPNAMAKIAGLENDIIQLEGRDLTDEVIDAMYQEAKIRRDEIDDEALIKLMEYEDRINQPLREPEGYEPADIEFRDLEETNIQVGGTERQVLAEQGLSESHDKIMARYETLADEEKAIQIGEDGRSAGELIADYEKQLELVENLVRCTRNA